MTPTPRLFRAMLVLHVVLGLMAPALYRGHAKAPGESPSGISRMGEMLIAAFPSLDWSAVALLFLGALALYVVAQVVAILALLDFRPWAPRFALAVFLISGGLRLLPGSPAPTDAWEGVLNDLSNMILVGTLAMAYFSPVKQRFARAKDSPEQGLFLPLTSRSAR